MLVFLVGKFGKDLGNQYWSSQDGEEDYQLVT